MSAAEEVDVEVEKEEKEAGTEDSTKGEPLEENAKGALIVPGVRARLSNIADDGTWIKTEKYEYAGYTQTRTAGKSAGQALRSHLELQRALCREVEVFSEPAACADPVLMNWMLQDQVPVYPCRIERTDQIGTGALQQNEVRVCGGSTSVMQPTDTDYSRSFKDGLRKAQGDLRRDMKAAAAAEGEVPKLKCGPKEIIQTIYEAQQLQKK